ncbi:hemA, partial [Symbiodinium sp. CCMP2592]
VLVITNRRPETTEALIWDHWSATLTCLLELSLYGLYLQSPPAKHGALLVDTKESRDDAKVQEEIQQEMKREWDLVLEMEDDAASRNILYKACPWVGYQCFREVPTFLSERAWKLDGAGRELLEAWHPKVGMSANVEDIFASIQDSVLRSSKNNDSAMCNIQCCAIRSFQKRMCGDDGPSTTDLRSEDFEGASVRGIKPKIWQPAAAATCDELDTDQILKPFESTTAFNHCKSQLNWFKVFLEAKRLGKNIVEASRNFWGPSVLQRGHLVHVALPLREFDIVFEGSLPKRAVDETKVLAKEDGSKEPSPDGLKDGESVKVLSFVSGTKPVQKMLLDVGEARVFDYTLHWATGPLVMKVGLACFLRRSMQGVSVLVFLMKTAAILKLTSDNLSCLLQRYDVVTRKNCTKSFKIRQLMKVQEVTAACTAEQLESLDQKLNELDAKRRKDKSAQKDDGSDQEVPDENFGEMMDDPAAEFAEQMLREIDDEEDEQNEGEPEQ